MGRQNKAAQPADETEAMTLGQLADDGCPHGDEPAALFAPDAPEKQEPPEPFDWQPYGHWGYSDGAPVTIGAELRGEVILTLRVRTRRGVRNEVQAAADALTTEVREGALARLFTEDVFERMAELRPGHRRAAAAVAQKTEAADAARKAVAVLAQRRPAPSDLATRLVAAHKAVSEAETARKAAEEEFRAIRELYEPAAAAIAPRLLELLNEEYKRVHAARQERLEARYAEFVKAGEDHLTELAILARGGLVFQRPNHLSLASDVISAPDDEDTAAE